MKHYQVALLGFGTVGSGVYRVLTENGKQITHREEIEISISGFWFGTLSTSRT